MKKKQVFGVFLIPSLLLILSTSCKKEIKPGTMDESITAMSKNGATATGSSKSNLLNAVRAATAKFHSTNQAIMAGYEPDDHCVSVPGLGGMGYHWANISLVDPVFDPLKPEVVLYATGPGGNLKLVALEYVVINVGQPAPMFGDQPFDVGGAPVPVPHWTLHVWLYEPNPSGMFAPFNPNVTCP